MTMAGGLAGFGVGLDGDSAGKGEVEFGGIGGITGLLKRNLAENSVIGRGAAATDGTVFIADYCFCARARFAGGGPGMDHLFLYLAGRKRLSFAKVFSSPSAGVRPGWFRNVL